MSDTPNFTFASSSALSLSLCVCVTDDEEGHIGNINYEEAVQRLLIFMPPRYHLLMKVRMRPDSSVVSVRTDFWRVLPYIDPFIDSLLRNP